MRVLRPFLSLVFSMLALLCGLTEMSLNQNYWTDVIVGFALGIAMAIYLVVFPTIFFFFIFLLTWKIMVKL